MIVDKVPTAVYSEDHGSLTSRRSTSIASPQPSRGLYNRQLQLLLWSTAISSITFLFFFLNLYAFIMLMVFFSSLTMLIHTSLAYFKYLLQSGEVNVFTLLPKQVQDYVLQSSLHDVLLDVTNNVYCR
mmetsp:Transcript_15826/g.23799  ORF Transcript_15826/g.23799 Transcript_15826/m.23799 type:complete len:128 (-) Transcript_15826:638-1021(-)